MRKLRKGEVIWYYPPYKFANGIITDSRGKTVCSFNSRCTASAIGKVKLLIGGRVIEAGEFLAAALNNSNTEYELLSHDKKSAQKSAPSDNRKDGEAVEGRR